MIVEVPEQLKSVDKIVLPGVGSFPEAMANLSKYKFIKPLQLALMHKPTLGICLGMQILARIGMENGKTSGLSIFDAEVKQICCEGVIPHMGFNRISIQKDNKLLKGLDDANFYFMHSYEVVNYRDVTALTTYIGHEFVSAIAKDNVYGVQFHPEKSRDVGIELFKNFLSI